MHRALPALVALIALCACRSESDPLAPPPPDPTPSSNLNCEEGAVRETEIPCGPEREGVQIEVCAKDQWTSADLCLSQPTGSNRSPGRINFFAGYAPVDWDYGEPRNNQVRGWSYYLRAFDLVRDQPVQEVGWGQWTKPEPPREGLEVCGIHPHGFTCEPYDASETELLGCGHTDPLLLEQCKVWCCSEDDKCGVRGSIEGGMGYWMYTLETSHVKWMMPGATNMNYELFGGTFLHDRPQPCTNLGGAVRVSNRLLVPNDFLSFSGEDIDGFVGYMLAKTPIGKRSDTDEANYWTIIIDTANFAGPVMYMSSWFWDTRINWSPKSVSWSDPRATIGYIAQGFEGAVGYLDVVDAEGHQWMRTNRWAFPRDRESDGTLAPTSTLFTGHAQYNRDWASTAIEPMLAGTGPDTNRSPSAVRAAAMTARTAVDCAPPHEESQVGFGIDLPDEEGELTWEDLGARAISEEKALSAANVTAGCKMSIALDPSRLDCETTPGWCEGDRFLRRGPDDATEVVAARDVPETIQRALELPRFRPVRRNDGRYLGPPAESEAVCFERPGPAPADPRLYCTRTESGVWLGFRWYRFVDQPELNQVFASLPEADRDAAKCFMQARIERLHAAQQSAGELPRWFEPPQGPGTLPTEKASLDPALLVTPPSGMEVGFVPITVFERKREKPQGCEVVLGAAQEEPDPLTPADYGPDTWSGGGYDNEMCPANPESGAAFTYPGTIFGYPVRPTPLAGRHGHLVPLRAEVASTLSATSPTCGLASDP